MWPNFAIIGAVVLTEIDARDLLEHLVDVCKSDAMEMAILVHSEKIFESCTLCFKNGVFNGCEL